MTCAARQIKDDLEPNRHTTKPGWTECSAEQRPVVNLQLRAGDRPTAIAARRWNSHAHRQSVRPARALHEVVVACVNGGAVGEGCRVVVGPAVIIHLPMRGVPFW